MGNAYIGMEPQNPFYQEVRTKYVASNGQTLFTGLAYKPGYIDVYVNGSKLVEGVDFTALNGNSVTLTTALNNNDDIEIQTRVPTQIVDVLNHETGVPRAELASNAGAGLIGYLLVGNGAVNTDVQTHLRNIDAYKNGAKVISVDMPPFNGDFLSAYNSIDASGNAVLLLGKRSYSIFGIGSNVKPNIAIVGQGRPRYDYISKKLIDGSGTVLQGQLYNQAKGINVFNLGIDYGDWVRVNLAGGQYNDVFSNIDVGENANIKYGDITILASDVVVGNSASNTHCILNQTGTGFQQTGIVEVIGGYHGHVIKVYDFIGSTTIARYQTGTGLIIKTDAGASAGKVNIDSVVINGDNSRLSSGVLLEAQTQYLSNIHIGKIIATHSSYVIAEAAATDSPIVDVSIGSILAGAITGGNGATQAVVIGKNSVGYKIGQHQLNACTNGGIHVATGAVNVDIGSGYSKSSSSGDGYKFDAPARHGPIYAGENAGWGVRNNGNPQLNATDVLCVQNTLGGISVVTTLAVTLQNSWADSQGTFRVVKYGSEIRISGQLSGGSIGSVGDWVTVGILSSAWPVFDEFISCAGFVAGGNTVPLMAKVTSNGHIQIYGLASQSAVGFSLSGSYVAQGNG